jgi:glyoxylase-like metal-dependent hydrolase (beta-lactamase superfamily II)
MGASVFDTIHMNSADEVILEEHSSLGICNEFIRMNIGEQFDLLKESDYIMPRTFQYNLLNPGDVFDLGGLTLEIYEGKGHTPGSITILLQEERTLLLGDACNNFTFLFGENSASVEEYKNMLLQLKEKTKGKFDRVYLSHGDGDAPKEMLDSVIEVCGDILEHNTDDVPFEFLGETAYIAKAITREMSRIDGGIGNIVYDKKQSHKR